MSEHIARLEAGGALMPLWDLVAVAGKMLESSADFCHAEQKASALVPGLSDILRRDMSRVGQAVQRRPWNADLLHNSLDGHESAFTHEPIVSDFRCPVGTDTMISSDTDIMRQQ